jgi:hypothetical protein
MKTWTKDIQINNFDNKNLVKCKLRKLQKQDFPYRFSLHNAKIQSASRTHEDFTFKFFPPPYMYWYACICRTFSCTVLPQWNVKRWNIKGNVRYLYRTGSLFYYFLRFRSLNPDRIRIYKTRNRIRSGAEPTTLTVMTPVKFADFRQKAAYSTVLDR